MTTDIWTARAVEASTGITVAVAAFALAFPRFGEKFFQRLERALSNFARRKALSLAILFLSVIAARLLLLPLRPVPIPSVHDEYSYLLNADTFAHGRLANPPHPLWESFETFHVNWLPTYSSKYPPAQGLLLAIGQLFGHPWIGVLLGNAAMCAAIFWMLQAWLPARWAFLGGLVALKLGIDTYWMDSYWGGAVAATGGALVLGALPRVVKQARLRDAIFLGLGIAVLANSRPYEGFLFSLPAAVWFVLWLLRGTKSKAPLRDRAKKALVPLLLVLSLTGAMMGYYNWRLTGHPLLLPYVLNTRLYQAAQPFLWEPARPLIHYRNQQFDDFYNRVERKVYRPGWRDVVAVTAEKAVLYAQTYLWKGALLLLAAVPFVFRDRKMRSPLATLALGAAAVLVVVWPFAHYAAPLTCVFYLLLVQAFRHLRMVGGSARPIGAALSRAIVLLLAIDTGMSIAREPYDPADEPGSSRSRMAILERLEHAPGKHLVIVRYQRNHNPHHEWVYNGAEIDSAKVLWARELDTEQNAKLLAYFNDRQIWLVNPDAEDIRLKPYSPLVSRSSFGR